jgi:hypothetical protein
MNKKNMREINSLYYTMIKSAVGAVFLVRQSILEVILEIAPIHHSCGIVSHRCEDNSNSKSQKCKEFLDILGVSKFLFNLL